jgi:predicted membrane-bound mannosyltransferase/DNA-binding beta-propeller fold protein YncE
VDNSTLRNASSESSVERAFGLPIPLKGSTFLLALLLAATIFTRFYALGTRVMSHDETTHVYFSWLYQQGRGYSHDPLSHGPLQFHLIALSYFLFGDGDASARIPAAISGVLAVALVFAFRRWIGRTAAFLTAALVFASPYLLYYSRYARNESFVVAEALVMFYAVLAYLETRRPRYLYWFTAALALHFCTKETSYIYAGLLGIFLAALLAINLVRRKWENPRLFAVFLLGLAAAALGGGAALYVFISARTTAGDTATLAISPVFLFATLVALMGLVLLVLGLILAFGRRLRSEFPALDLLIITVSFTLPQLAGIPAQAMGWDPIAYSDPTQWTKTVVVVAILAAVAVALGLVWNWRVWVVAAGIFLGIYIPLYTSLFSHPFGLFTGLVGSLGYWLVQQGVQRGTQPLYYYAIIQIPIYESLPALGALLAAAVGIGRWLKRPETPADSQSTGEPQDEVRAELSRLYPALFGYWSIASLLAFTFAGERMPWITVHIALPLILLAGWTLAAFAEKVQWSRFQQFTPWVLTLLTGLALLSFARAVGYLVGNPPPFQGMQLEQLGATTGVLTGFAVCLASLYAVYRLSHGWSTAELFRLGGVVALVGLYGLTLRASLRASFVNYDDATEFLVYAHSASGPKIALSQVEDLSRRLTGGQDIDVGYDNLSTYPFWWYLRDYPNAHYFGTTPSRDLLNYPVILAGSGNYTAVEAVLRNRYYTFEYTRMWWPSMEYFNLTWERVRNAITSPVFRDALWDIWLNRDYTAYGQAIGKDFSLRNWDPSEKMKLYVRKDILAMVWDYGVAPGVAQPELMEDPYASKLRTLEADKIIGGQGASPGLFMRPRGMAVAPDGNLLIADTSNHRVQRLSPEGEVLSTWGQYANLSQGTAPGGTFNEPWGIAVAPNGTVYVADTWNHRIQHFSPTGRFLSMFGVAGQAETPDALWGPRGIAVDEEYQVFVADTGNKRVSIFDRNDQALGEFGGAGALPGMLDEPVGVAVGPEGTIYVADTWNQRIQAFRAAAAGEYNPVLEFALDAWYGQSLENKPYLAVGPQGQICATDPEGYRVLCFDAQGEFLVGWGEPGAEPSQFGLPAGIAFDDDCGVWVVDSVNARLMHFNPGLCQ